jgi:hypothetical protein
VKLELRRLLISARNDLSDLIEEPEPNQEVLIDLPRLLESVAAAELAAESMGKAGVK